MRLSKIAKDFNVGIQTLVEFLNKKGKPATKWGPMSNVPDDLYEQLSREFNKDKSVKLASERERQERLQTRDKIKEETRQINAVNSGVTQSQVVHTSSEEQIKQQEGPKVLGHIDLNALNRPAPKKEQQKPQHSQAPRKEMPKHEGQKQGGAPRQQEQKAARANREENKKPNQSIWGERSRDRISDEPLPAEAKNGEVFRLNQAAGPQLNVVGTIDLNALNQSTRPKKKSKEEKKKEREQKSMNNRGGDDMRGSRRQHGAQKVDINEEINRNKSKNQDRRDRRDKMEDGRGKHAGKDKKKGQQAYKQEINDADVQQQVKDTLARLTNKPDKKAVKYRKDKRNAAAQAAAQAEEAEAAQSKILKLTEFVTANDLATMMNVSVIQVIDRKSVV